MNGALLHATGQYVACFVFLFDNNIQKVDTFHSHNLTSVEPFWRTRQYGLYHYITRNQLPFNIPIKNSYSIFTTDCVDDGPLSYAVKSTESLP